MAGQEQIDFKVDTNNLYREDAITDLKVASIRRMIPVTAAGKDDASRSPIFFGHTQILTPQGPLPLQAKLMANNLTEAIRGVSRSHGKGNGPDGRSKSRKMQAGGAEKTTRRFTDHRSR